LIWQRLNVAGDEPAAQSVGSEERDGGDRYHDVSILIATGLGLGRWRGTQPAAKVSMISMRAPQHGQGYGGLSSVATPSVGSCRIVVGAGAAAAINSRVCASFSALVRQLANRP
jgi:hypothetical protein